VGEDPAILEGESFLAYSKQLGESQLIATSLQNPYPKKV